MIATKALRISGLGDKHQASSVEFSATRKSIYIGSKALQSRPKPTRSTSSKAESSSALPHGILQTTLADSVLVETTLRHAEELSQHVHRKGTEGVMDDLPDGFFDDREGDELMTLYRSQTRRRRITRALHVLQEFVKAERYDVLHKINQKEFIDAAFKQKDLQSAFDFVELLPTACVDCRTYNMLVKSCARSQNVDIALQAVECMKARGIEPDVPIYTNLISAYGSQGNAADAFMLYAKMKEKGLKPDCKIAGALATACAKQLKESNDRDRRESLVLLDRAFGLISDLKTYNVKPDTTLCNALITCAGRIGQVQRAIDLLKNFHVFKCKANSVTYAALIDGCIKADRKDLAKSFYKTAIREISDPDIALYTSALEACCCGPDQIDSEMAFEIYKQAERSGLDLDVHFFSTMIRVAGKTGDGDLALSVEDDMLLQGISQSTITCSALILAALTSKDLLLATKIYNDMASKSIYPNLHQFTNLIQAYRRSGRYGDMVRLMEDLIMNDLPLDDVVSDIVLWSFKDASMADMGFAVFTMLKGNGVAVSQRLCYTMLDICHIQIKALQGAKWTHPNKRFISVAEGMVLLRALSGKNRVPEVQPVPVSVWIDRSIAIYKSVMSANITLSLPILSKVLACLRISHVAAKTQTSKEFKSFDPYSDTDADDVLSDLTAMKKKRESCFDNRVVQLVMEAATVRLVPAFTTECSSEIDLRSLPPCVAEAYVFTLLETIAFRCRRTGHFAHSITFTVVPYNPKRVMIPSGAVGVRFDKRKSKYRSREKPSETKSDTSKEERTSLAVVSILRRLCVRHKTHPSTGTIILSSGSISDWITVYSLEPQNHSVQDENYKSSFSAKLTTQQRDIRIMNAVDSAFLSD